MPSNSNLSWKNVFFWGFFFLSWENKPKYLSVWGKKKKKGNKIELMFQARRSPSCCRVEVVRHSLELRYTGIYQSEGDRSFSRQRDKKTKKKPFQFFFLPVREFAEIFCWDFFFQIHLFFFFQIHLFLPLLRWEQNGNTSSLQEYNFSNIAAGEIIYYLQNLRKLLEGCSFFNFCCEAVFL